MPRLTTDAWEDIRAAFEVGATFSDLARRFGVSRQRIAKRAKAENWQVDPAAAEQIKVRVASRVTSDPAKKEAALDQVADQAAEIIRRHRSEWQGHRGLYPLCDIGRNFEALKCSKIAAEMLGIRQRHERLCWGLDDPDQGDEVEIVIQRSWGLQE